jgi:hypothetical protein
MVQRERIETAGAACHGPALGPHLKRKTAANSGVAQKAI